MIHATRGDWTAMSPAAPSLHAVGADHRDACTLVVCAGVEREVSNHPAESCVARLGRAVPRTEVRADFDVRASARVRHLHPGDVVYQGAALNFFLNATRNSASGSESPLQPLAATASALRPATAIAFGDKRHAPLSDFLRTTLSSGLRESQRSPPFGLHLTQPRPKNGSLNFSAPCSGTGGDLIAVATRACVMPFSA